MKLRISAIADVARGSLQLGIIPSAAMSSSKRRHLGGGEVEVVHIELAGLAEHVVVDVGHVANASRLVAQIAQTALEHVVADVGGGVSEVRCVIRCDPARVHRDDVADLERHDGTTGSVIEVDHEPRA